MRAVVQRVTRALVRIEGSEHSRIADGLLVLVGVEKGDTEEDARKLAAKIVALRVFEDAEGRFNHSVLEAGGSLMAVSQFTLLGDCRKGRRPSFDRAAVPEDASNLYERFVASARATGVPVQTGLFQAMMDVELINNGPVTLLLDTRKKL